MLPEEHAALMRDMDPLYNAAEGLVVSLRQTRKEVLRKGEQLCTQLAACPAFRHALADLYLHRAYEVKLAASELLNVVIVPLPAVALLAAEPYLVERLLRVLYAAATGECQEAVLSAGVAVLWSLSRLARYQVGLCATLSTAEVVRVAVTVTRAGGVLPADKAHCAFMYYVATVGKYWTDGVLGVQLAPIILERMRLPATPQLQLLTLSALAAVLAAEAAYPAYVCVLRASLAEIPKLVGGLVAGAAAGGAAAVFSANAMRLSVILRLLRLEVQLEVEQQQAAPAVVDAGVASFIECLNSGAAAASNLQPLMLQVVVAAACATPGGGGSRGVGAVPCCVALFCAAVAAAAPPAVLLPVMHALDDLIRTVHHKTAVATALQDHLPTLVHLLQHRDESVARASARVLAVLVTREQAAAATIAHGGVNALLQLLERPAVRLRTQEDALYTVNCLVKEGQQVSLFVAAGYVPACERLLLSCAASPTVHTLAALIMRRILTAPASPALLEAVQQLTQPWRGEPRVRAAATALLLQIAPELKGTAACAAAAAAAAVSHPFDVPVPPLPCVICMGEETRAWSVLPCCHMFHEECIRGWIVGAKRLTCPTCQYPLV